MSNSAFISLTKRILLRKFYQIDCVYAQKRIMSVKDDFIFILNNIKYIHYGDILFYLPLIIVLSRKFRVKIYTSEKTHIFIKYFLKSSKNIVITQNKFINTSKAIIIVHPYEFTNYQGLNTIGLGLPSDYIDKKYPEYLIHQLYNYLGIDYLYDYSEVISCISFDETPKSNEKKIKPSIFISPYLNSGKFRDMLDFKKKKILNTALNLALEKNLNLLLIGDIKDRLITYSSKNIIDMRNTNIIDSIQIVRNSNIKIGVGFDNFWMHYCNLIKKPYTVIFRGRFSKMHHLNHINFINNSFLR